MVRKNLIRKNAAIFILIWINAYLFAQQEQNSILLVERSIDRPLTVHKNQLQINAGYDFSMLSRRIDESGNRINLSKAGIASAMHTFPMDVRYGILEFLELSTGTSYKKSGIRSEDYWIFSGSSKIRIQDINEHKGFEDIFLKLGLRLPLKLKSFDWSVSGSVTLPVAKYKPDKPNHEAILVDPVNNSYIFNCHYNNRFGTGVPTLKTGSAVKLRTDRIAVRASANYLEAFSSGENINWKSRRIYEEFEYTDLSYKYLPSQVINCSGVFTYQAIAWFSQFVLIDYYKIYGGWSEITGKRVANEDRYYLFVSFGFEIQVSPYLRLFQLVELPGWGNNTDAPVCFTTNLSFNILTSK